MRVALILIAISSAKLYLMISGIEIVEMEPTVDKKVVAIRKKVVGVEKHTSKLDSLYIHYPNKRK